MHCEASLRPVASENVPSGHLPRQIGRNGVREIVVFVDNGRVFGLSARCEGQRLVSSAWAAAVPRGWTGCAGRGLEPCAVAPSRAHVAGRASGAGRELPRETRKADGSRCVVRSLAAGAGGAAWCGPGAWISGVPLNRGVCIRAGHGRALGASVDTERPLSNAARDNATLAAAKHALADAVRQALAADGRLGGAPHER